MGSESRGDAGEERKYVWGKGNLYFFSFSISISLSFSPSSRRNGKAEAFFSSLRLDFSEHSSRAPLCSLMRLLLFISLLKRYQRWSEKKDINGGVKKKRYHQWGKTFFLI